MRNHRILDIINEATKNSINNKQPSEQSNILEEPVEDTTKFSGRRTALYDAIRQAGISGEYLFKLEDSYSDTKTKAETLSEYIDKFKQDNNIITDLSGEDLVDALVVSITRLKIYFWYAFNIYQLNITSNNLDPRVTLAALQKPNKTQLQVLHDLFSYLPKEIQTIIFSKSDFLTRNLKKSLSEQSDIIKLLLHEAKLNPETIPLEDTLVEEVPDILYDRILNTLIKEYTTASSKDIPTIDEKIYSYFSNPWNIAEKLKTARMSAKGYTDFTVDPETGKRTPKLNPANVRSLHEPISGGDEQTVYNDLAQLPITSGDVSSDIDTDVALEIPPEPSDEISSKTSVEVSDAEKKTRLIFGSDNILLKYFNNINYVSIVAEYISRETSNPKSYISYYDINTSKMARISLWELLHNSSKGYVSETSTTIATLTIDVLAETAPFLITLEGTPVTITEEIKHNIQHILDTLAEQHATGWFELSNLSQINKEYLRKYLHLEDTIPPFEIKRVSLKQDTFKERILDALRIKQIQAVSDYDKEKITQSINVINELTDIVRIKLEAYKILSSKEIDTILQYSKPTKGATGPKTDPVTSDTIKKVAAVLHDVFAVLNPTTLDKIFTLNGTQYNKKQLPTLLQTLSSTDLELLWNNIKSGEIKTNLNIPFMELSKTGNGQRLIAQFTQNIEHLIEIKKTLTESMLYEAVKDNAVQILTQTYLEFFTNESIPVLQTALLDIKKLGPFLVSVITKFKKYGQFLEYLKAKEHGLTTKEIPDIDDNELLEIEDLQDYFVAGPNKLKYAGHQLINDLKRDILPETIIDKLTDAFLDNKNNPSYTSPLLDPAIIKAYPKMKQWLLNTYDKDNKYGFKYAFSEAEKTGSLSPVKQLLTKHYSVIENLLGGKVSKEPGAILKIIKSILYGLYSGYAPINKPKTAEEQQKEPSKPGPSLDLSFLSNL